jgi:uncharacterized membrane protein
MPPATDRKPDHEAFLSRQAAPPTRKPAVMWTVAGVVFLTVAILAWSISTAMTTAALVAVAIAIGFSARAMTYNGMVYPRLYEQWERSSLCNRCGNVFVG